MSTDAALARTLAPVVGRPVPSVVRRPWAYSSTAQMEEVDVPAAGLRLLLKDCSPPSPRPGFAHDPGREAAAYRTLAALREVGAPACYGSIRSPDDGRPQLVLERIDGTPLWQEGDVGVWESAARTLARLHAVTPPDRRGLVRYDMAHHRRWLARARALTGAAVLDAVDERFSELLGPLARWPDGTLHGEAYPSNVLVERRGSAPARIRLVDWETVGVGPGVLDLAALTAGSWDRGRRARVERAYLAAAGCAGDVDVEDFDAVLRAARLAIAVQWLGFAPEWEPPEEHRHDWLADVAALVTGEGRR